MSNPLLTVIEAKISSSVRLPASTKISAHQSRNQYFLLGFRRVSGATDRHESTLHGAYSNYSTNIVSHFS